MEFDEQNQEFVLESEEMALLHVHTEMGHWPLSDAETLIIKTDAVQVQLQDFDATEYPYGSIRHEMLSMFMRKQRVLHQLRSVLAQHATIDEETIRRLQGE